MNVIAKVLLAGAAMIVSPAAIAQDEQGKIQIKLLATYVDPSAEITSVNRDLIGLPADSQTKADTNITPTAAVEYFVTPNISIETIAGVTQHDVMGSGALSGAQIISNANIIPATLTAKYHFDLGGFKPYIGAGPSYFLIFGEDPGADARALGATRANLSEELGVAVQAGFDVPLNDQGLGLSVDAKRYFIGTTARFFAGNTLVLSTEHDLDPWVVSAGLSYRF